MRQKGAFPAIICPGLAFDERLGHFAGDLILELGRSLHEVGSGGEERAAYAAVETELDTAHRVDDHAGGVGRIPDFQVRRKQQGHVAEGGALHADFAELAVIQPGHIIRRADMHITRLQLVGHHAGHRASLGDLLGFQAFAFEHVHEVGVAAEVELVGMVQMHAAVNEEAGQHAVHNGGAYLALNVIADDGQVPFREARRQ